MRRQYYTVLSISPLIPLLRPRVLIMSASYAHAAAAPTRSSNKSVVTAPIRDHAASSQQPSENGSSFSSHELASDRHRRRRPHDAKPAPAPAPQHTNNTAPFRRGAAQDSAASYSSYYRPTTNTDDHDAPSSSPPRVFVLTLRTGPPALEARLSAQRQRWLPPARLRVPDAHVTVFHALPAAATAVECPGTLVRGEGALMRAARALPPRVPIRLGPAFRMGRQGVAVGVSVVGDQDEDEAGVLGRTRRELVREWLDEGNEDGPGDGALSPQDRRMGWRPHYTVLNKEGDAARVDACLEALVGEEPAGGASGEVAEGWADGFVLWRYERDGRWTWAREFGFGEGVVGEE